MISFRPGVPDVDVFLFNAWHQAARRWDRLPKTMLGYGNFSGYAPFREQIAIYLKDARGVRCEPDQVLIVNGSQQALDLSARVLLDPGDSAFVEDPGYLGVKGALLGAGAKLIPLPIDDQGVAIAKASAHPESKLAYVTPSFQYPLGITMPLPRRLEWLAWAQSSPGWILEDDYDSQYRYAGAPLPALQGLDRHERVIYLGTFSKVMFPALRLGYMVVPRDLIKPFSQARALTDHHSPTIQQGVMAQFMAEGHFARHIRRMRALYKRRQAHLLTCCDRLLKGILKVRAAEAGMHVMAWLPNGWDDRAVSTHLARRGIEALAYSHFTLRRPKRGGLLLGYPALSEHRIEAGIRRMAEALRGFRPVQAR
jgi:GntR family transcriptional regulator/MocR family aminotransferase